MAKVHYFVEEESGWKDGCYQKLITWKPVEQQEAQLIQEALHLKELARAQQKLLEPYRNQGAVISVTRSRKV
jgi:hypothetical protein